MSLRPRALAPARAAGLVSGAAVSAGCAASCAVTDLQQQHAFLPPLWFHPQLQLIAWPLSLFVQGRLFQRFVVRVLKVSWTQVLPQTHMLYSGSLVHQRLFGQGPSSVMINSRNLQLVLPLSSYPLPYRLVPAWKAVTCVSYVCQSENVLGFLFLK